MPEIVEAQMLVDGLQPIIGSRITNIITDYDTQNILTLELADQIIGNAIVGVWRHAKRPIISFATDDVLEVFLSMTGTFGLNHEPRHTRIAFELDSGDTLYYADMRKWGRMKLYDKDWYKSQIVKTTGFDTLFFSSTEFNNAMTRAQSENLKNDEFVVKDMLMDERYLIGLGNIYAQEIAFDAALQPHRPVNTLVLSDIVRLGHCIRNHIQMAYKLGGLSVSNYTHADGSLGKASDLNHVYRKKNCKRCNTEVGRIEISGRSTYYCPTCQK